MPYTEPDRQQLVYSTQKGWLNDPNGLIYINGEYHMFHQYNPFGAHWANMHWYHAVSKDLIHWQECGIALEPDESGTMYSGGALLLKNGGTPFGDTSQDKPILLLFYTAAGKPHTQNIAYSLDGGKTITKWAGNPVVGSITNDKERDPSVQWDENCKCWRMALYLGNKSSDFALLRSSNLTQWEVTDRFKIPDNGQECPELIYMTDTVTGEKKWVVTEASGKYVVADIVDDKLRISSHGSIYQRPTNHGFYAAQSFKNHPEGRTIFIAWIRDNVRNETFSQSMSFPFEVTLVNGTLKTSPISAIDSLHTDKPTGSWKITFTTDSATRTISLFGKNIVFDGGAKEIRIDDAAIKCQIASSKWMIFLDTNNFQLFGADGTVCFASSYIRNGVAKPAEGDLPPDTILTPLASIWTH